MLDFRHEPAKWQPLTPQEIFTKAYVGLVLQGRGSTKSNQSCAYRGVEGAMCGVGMVIDDATAHDWDGRMNSSVTAISKTVSRNSEFGEWLHDNLPLLADIQKAHDNSWTHASDGNADRVTNFVAVFHLRAKAVADTHGLTVPDVTALIDITEPVAA